MTPAPPAGREPTLPSGWETVVGLEVHVELATATKLFCGCPNRFGDEPNTNVCPVCLGLPGSLPVVNARAVEFAMRLGRALGCEARPSVFARKNYFYPDMPKDYQISQYDQPVNVDGRLELPDGRVVGIERAHIEEDTGKTAHMGGAGRIHGASHLLVDYNRAGVPLVEIVSRPDIRAAEQARAFARELRAILLATGVSDARMEEGSMRVDANVSVRPARSDELRTRCEIKNLSSVRALGKAVAYEARRHFDLWSAGDAPRQETRHWHEQTGRTTAARSKEEAEDYRYFPDPDLAPLTPDPGSVAAIDAALPRLPAARREALSAAGRGAISAAAAALLVERGQDELVSAALAAGAEPARAATRVVNDLAVDDWSLVTPQRLAALVRMEADSRLTATQAKRVLAEVARSGDEPADIAERLGYEAMGGDDLAAVVDGVIAGHPEEWRRFCAGDSADSADRKKMAGFLTGQVMRATRGRADGAAVSRLLRDRASLQASSHAGGCACPAGRDRAEDWG